MDMLQPQTARSSHGAPVPVGSHHTCCVCHKLFSADNMVFIAQQWVCAECKPRYVQMVNEGTFSHSYALFREGNCIVMAQKAVLPDRCVKCNAPAYGRRLKRRLFWHPPLYFLLVLVSPLVYIIVALIVRKTATIEIGLCDRHRQARVFAIIAGWFAVALAVTASIATGDPMIIVISALAALIVLIWAAVVAAVVAVKRMEHEFLWVSRAGRKFLDSLPTQDQAGMARLE